MTRNPRPDSLVLALAALLVALPAHAEKADRDKPIFIESDNATSDDANKVSVFTGNAVLTQGTLVIKGDKLVMKEDPEGFQYGTAYGNPASFRQKREGLDEYIEGYGLRIEYDGKADKVELFDKARMKRGQDDVRGDYISYDGKTEFFNVKGAAANGQPSRVHAIIMPKKKDGAAPKTATPAPAAKPATP